MRLTGNFNPEWGYLAPVPSFVRTARIAIVAAAIGATAGAAVVFSLVDRPAADESVAARTLARPLQAAAAVALQPQRQAQSQMAETSRMGPSQPVASPPVGAHTEGSAAADSGHSTTQHPMSAAALAEAPAVDTAPALDEAAAAPDVAVQKKAIKKPATARNVWRNTPRVDQADRGPLALLHSLSARTATGIFSRGEY